MTLPVFPTLPGLKWSVTRRPSFASISRSADNLREIFATAQSKCLYEFELTYSFLRNKSGYTELQQLLGLFLQLRGDYDIFLFQDPTDFQVAGAQIGTGDGANTNFTLGRNTGPNNYEAVGYLDKMNGIYINGTFQDETTYSFLPPNTILFNSAPASGAIVTANFSYYYLCRFMDDAQDYDQFLYTLFQLKSCRFKSVVY
ncbi:MAG: DUF2460 domain-containing protein [Sphingomonadales bacterium]|nr:DUF2460 domain-containing protein [Sphingomonadales bacterium]MDE2171172.1 DUF2460 domain-containing protein [Sphingomonadales bacterium]